MKTERNRPESGFAERTAIAREYIDRVTRIAGLSQREPLIHQGFEYTAEANLATNNAIEGPTLFIKPIGAEEDKVQKFEMHLHTVTLSRYTEEAPPLWQRVFGGLLSKSGIEDTQNLKLERVELEPSSVAMISEQLGEVIEDSAKLKSVK